MKKISFFACLMSMKKGVGSGVGKDPDTDQDPDPHQNVTDPQLCFLQLQYILNSTRNL